MASLSDHLPSETLARFREFLDRHAGELIDGTMYVLPREVVEGATAGAVTFAIEPQNDEAGFRALGVELTDNPGRVLLLYLRRGVWGGAPIAESIEDFLEDPAWKPRPPL